MASIRSLLFDRGPLSGAGRLPVAVDCRFAASRSPGTALEVAERAGAPSLPSALKRAYENRRRSPIAVLAAPSSDGLRIALDLPGCCVIPLEAVEEWSVAYAGSIELPEESRLLYDVRHGAGVAEECESFVTLHLLEAERPFDVVCHVCNGARKVPCRRCEGKGYVSGRSGIRRECPAGECIKGDVPCRYCKGAGSTACGVLRQDGRIKIRLPRDLQTEPVEKIALRVGGERVSPGRIELFNRLQELMPSTRELSEPPLVQAERRFDDALAEMEEFVAIELSETCRSLPVAQISDGSLLEERPGKEAVLQYRLTRGLPHGWSKGDAVLIAEHPRAPRTAARIGNVSGQHVQLRVSLRQERDLAVPVDGILVRRSDVKPLDVEQRAIDWWRSTETLLAPIKRALCAPEDFAEIPLGAVPELFDKNIAQNPAQVDAVRKALTRSLPLVCIQGPPGTGKTSVICEIIRQQLATDPGIILVTSQANLAVDNVLERLLDLPGIRLVRLGNPENVQESLLAYTKSEVLARARAEGSNPTETNAPAGVWGSIALGFKSLFGADAEPDPIEEEPAEVNDEALLARSVDVIGATCIGSDDPLIRFLRQSGVRRISLVIVDEVGRSTPMETLVPLQFGRRGVLVGDHKQLPPVLSTEVRDAWQKAHPERPIEQCPGAVSLFESTIARLPPNAVAVLNKQFRMHPIIGDFVRSVFYADEGLENGVTSRARSLPIPGLPESLSYHSTIAYGDDRYERVADGTSKVNVAEADLIWQLLHYLDPYVGEGGASVGVIAFYKAQVDLIRRRVEQAPPHNLDLAGSDGISTLDAYQGKEKDIMMLSLVRCPKHVDRVDAEWYRFFLDVRRMNVALSRARKRLLIVGDLDQLLLVRRNRSKLVGFEVLDALKQYIDSHGLAVG